MRSFLFDFIAWFAGMGCSTQGYLRAGGRGRLAVDRCDTALATHALNLRGIPTLPYDLTEASADDLSRIMRDHAGIRPRRFTGLHSVTAPCQGFTRSRGAPRPSDPLNRLVLIAGRLATASPRSWILIENVRGMLSKDGETGKYHHERVLNELLDMIRDGRGLKLKIQNLDEYLLPGKHCGLAQKRERLVLPIPPRGVEMPDPLRPRLLDEQQAFLGQLIGPGSGFEDPDKRKFEPLNEDVECKVYQYLLPGESLYEAEQRLGSRLPTAIRQAFSESAAKQMRRLGWNSQPTVRTPARTRFWSLGKMDLVHPTELRFLSVREMGALQEIPTEWALCGDTNEQYEQIANGFPASMAEMAARAYVLGEYPKHYTPNVKRTHSVMLYPGSKDRLAREIVDSLSSAIEVIGSYYEPFAGSAAVALEVARRSPKARIHLNDLDPNIASFWSIVAHGTKGQQVQLAELLEQQPTRKLFERYKEDRPRSKVECAYKAIFIGRSCYNYYIVGGYSATRASRYPSDLPERLFEHVELLAGRTTVTQHHFRNVLNTAPPGAPTYLDPPYWDLGRHYYDVHMTEPEHEELARLLRGRKNWILSYGDETAIRGLYTGCLIRDVPTGYDRRCDLLITPRPNPVNTKVRRRKGKHLAAG